MDHERTTTGRRKDIFLTLASRQSLLEKQYSGLPLKNVIQHILIELAASSHGFAAPRQRHHYLPILMTMKFSRMKKIAFAPSPRKLQRMS